MIRQTVAEYIKERYGVNMGYEQICPVCKAHLDADEKCDCIEKRQQAVQLLRERLADGATCRMNIETLDCVYFENVKVCMGENNTTLEVVAGKEPDSIWITLDLDKIVDVEIVNEVEVWLRDEKTGTEIGRNADGELFIGNEFSGGNYPDTPENREKLYRDFCRYTGRRMPIISASGKPIPNDCSVVEFSR